AMAYVAGTTAPVVQARTVATEVLLQGTRAIGVRALQDGRPMTYYADEVVLSCGAVKSPHLLLLSGIGRAELLRRHGIPVVVDLRGVGQGFMDHPATVTVYDVDDREPAPLTRSLVQVGLTWAADGSSAPPNLELIVPASAQDGRTGFSC